MSRLKLAVAILGAVALLAGCSGTRVDTSGLAPLTGDRATSQALAPSASPPEVDQTYSAPPPPMTAAELPTVDTASDAPVGDVRLDFAPVVGAGKEALTALAARLAVRAGERGVPLAENGGATHVVRGYFSATTTGRNTTVGYVWDVSSPDGQRLHRIQGQQTTAARGGEGWDAVDDATMETIADRTIDELALWLSPSG